MAKKLTEYLDFKGDKVKIYKRVIDGVQEIYAQINIRNKLVH